MNLKRKQFNGSALYVSTLWDVRRTAHFRPQIPLIGDFAYYSIFQLFIARLIALGNAARVGMPCSPISLRIILILIVVGLIELQFALQCLEHHIAIFVKLTL